MSDSGSCADSVPGALLESPADGIALLRLNRPGRLNALDDAAVREIGRLLDRSAVGTKEVTVTPRFNPCAAGPAARASTPDETSRWF